MPDLSIFQFSCQFYFLVGPGRLDGLMVSNGSQLRIAVYWIEPDVFREGASFVRYSDFIFASDLIHYWVHPLGQRGAIFPSDNHSEPLLPRQDSVESIARSALAVVNRVVRGRNLCAGTPLEVGKFFHGSRGLPEYAYEAVHGQTDCNDPATATNSDVQTLNALPAGREYFKERQNDGTLVWHVRRASVGPPVATVIVKPATRSQERDCPTMFDPNTLGQCMLIPESYRVYWSFDRALWEVSMSVSGRSASCELCDRIESYVAAGGVPPQVRLAMNRLRLKAALMTDDMDRVRRSAQASAAECCQGGFASGYRAFLELARIGGQVEERYPQQPQEWFRPFVAETVRYVGRDIGSYIARLLPTIDANQWFNCGALFLDEIRCQDLMEEVELSQMTLRFEAMRLIRDTQPPDPCQPSARVREYLACLDTDPPRGPIDMNNVRRILEHGLEKYAADHDTMKKRDRVKGIIRSLSLIVGDGPFRGNQEELTAAIARFAERHFAMYGRVKPIDTVLATFLALSFCDMSTAEDHAVLVTQFHGQYAALQSQIDAMLTEAGLGALVGPDDVEHAFASYEQVFRKYVDDPLWPSFKFPLTSNEEARLAATLQLRLIRLESMLNEMSLKVKYGGINPQLRQRAVYEISHVARQLVVQTAFLRKPPYPGISCHYRGSLGFTAMIEGALYVEADRPKEKFRAMKYFHLGHRLQEVVERECELARHEQLQEHTQ